MKRRADFGQYVTVLADVMQTTEEMGGRLDPFYEKFRAALDEDGEVAAEDYERTKTEFDAGVEFYQKNLERLRGLQAPAAVIGMHKKLTGAYRRFREGCVHMNEAIDYDGHAVDAEAFNAAEKEQGDAMDEIARYVQKIMR